MIYINNFLKNRPKVSKYVSILLIIMFSIIFYRFTEKVDIPQIFPIILDVLAPFLYGAIIAYILNSSVRFIENKVFLRIKPLKSKPRKARNLAITTTFIIVIGVIIWLIAYIIPEMVTSIQNLVNFIVGFDYSSLEDTFEAFATKYNLTLSPEAFNYVIEILDSISRAMADAFKYVPKMLNTLMSGTLSFASSLFDLVMGICIAIYLLADKEKICEISSKSLYSIFSCERSEKIISIVRSSNLVFEKFFIGKTIDSFIIGVIFFIGAITMDLPYPLLLSLIIGITNMIPYFGPFLGAVPVAVLVLLVSPIKTIWVILFIFILQQFDGIILGPKILGDSIGSKPIGVIFSIIVGGAIAGPLGMFFGVPIFAVIFSQIFKTIESNYAKKNPTKQEEIL